MGNPASVTPASLLFRLRLQHEKREVDCGECLRSGFSTRLTVEVQVMVELSEGESECIGRRWVSFIGKTCPSPFSSLCCLSTSTVADECIVVCRGALVHLGESYRQGG